MTAAMTECRGARGRCHKCQGAGTLSAEEKAGADGKRSGEQQGQRMVAWCRMQKGVNTNWIASGDWLQLA
jgi:hypothetical protein